MASTTPTVTQNQWVAIAQKRLKKLLKRAQGLPAIMRLGPGCMWQAEVRIVGTAMMKNLNWKYRHKRKATDVLSFPTPSVFRDQGHLGDLVICLPTLKSQARELGHSSDRELSVLLVHGILHLLGLDHETSPREARQMARFEALLLPAGRLHGLIDRTGRAPGRKV